jgi:8-oxo-dGTP pyrophosphatase MutT (NUDIX family)
MDQKRFQVVPASYLILVNDGKILLSRRYNTGYEDGNYSLVAGHVDGNETFIRAMIREAQEEAGISLQPENLRVVHTMHRKCPNDERVDVFIQATAWTGEIKNMEPDKCDDLGWFNLDTLPINTIPYIKQAIECIQKNTFYSEYGW